jgi:hypothetical protein
MQAYIVPTDPVFLAGDDTVAERPVVKVFGESRYGECIFSSCVSTTRV